MAKPGARVEAFTLKVEDMLERLRSGEVRVPSFQRPLKWKATDNKLLFDSILNGFPIGGLLVWKREEPAEHVTLGPFETDAAGRAEAWRVVDGQQRLTALAGALLPMPHRPADYAFAVNLRTGAVEKAPKVDNAEFVPLHVLADTRTLIPWLHAHPMADIAAASEYSKRLRDYPLPVTQLETDDQSFVEGVFKRVNTTGKPLTQAEVFKASHARKPGGDALERALAVGPEFHFGELDESNLLRALKAVSGQDPLAEFDEPPAGIANALVRGTREAVVLLKQTGIPHADLLPFSLPFGVLVAFFAKHETVHPRNRRLAEMWFWRATLSLKMQGDFSVIRKTYGRAVVESEHEATQDLLLTVPVYPAVPDLETPPQLRSAIGRIVGLLMIDHAPDDLRTGEKLNISKLFATNASKELFQPLVPELSHAGMFNLILHPRVERAQWANLFAHAPHEALFSHLIQPPFQLDDDGIIERATRITAAYEEFAERKAAVAEPTTPPLSALGGPES